MNKYIEYKYKGKCSNCNDPLWTVNDLESVVCKCTKANIFQGVITNCIPVSDNEIIEYINIPNENIILIQL